MMRSLVKRRAVSMRAFCSSVSSKSIMVTLLPCSTGKMLLNAHVAWAKKAPLSVPSFTRCRGMSQASSLKTDATSS